MSLKVKPKVVIHYLLIYFMIILNQSNLYKYFLAEYNSILLVVLVGILIIKKRYRDYSILGFCLFLLIDVIITRFIVGGVGLSAWINWVLKIGFCYVAVKYDSIESFIKRYINVVVFLAGCSLVGYLIGIAFPSFFTSGLFTKYDTLFISERTWISENSYLAKYYNSFGTLFYTFTEHETLRNVGIFSEPGVYQMVLNSAIAMILFWGDKLSFKKRKNKIRCLAILAIALFTSQSTTGYIGFLATIAVYMFSKNADDGRIKYRVLEAIFVVTFLIAFDYGQRGSNSFIASTVLKKVLNASGSLDILADTGAYRWGMILVALKSMITHPFGVGYDSFRVLADAQNTGFVAAQVIQTGAVYGIPMFLGIIFWVVYPIIRYERRLNTKIIFIFLYFNTALAQSSEFYPTLIVFGIILYCSKGLFQDSRAECIVN